MKYQGQRFDVVIAMRTLAVEFVDQHRNELFPDTPVVFLATLVRRLQRVANSTGVIADLDLGSTLALAIELQPDIRNVFVVSGAGVADKAVREPGAGAVAVVRTSAHDHVPVGSADEGARGAAGDAARRIRSSTTWSSIRMARAEASTRWSTWNASRRRQCADLYLGRILRWTTASWAAASRPDRP